MVPSAYLRVFQPLDAFSLEEQATWERYIVEGASPPSTRPVYRQRPTAEGLGLLASVDGEHADLRVGDGGYYVCPWRTRLRVLASLVTLRGSQAIELAEELVPEGEARRAARELARLRRQDRSAVPFILQSAWHVPIRWFVLFEDEERSLTERPEGGYTLSYEATSGKAARRAQRAMPVLRKSDLGEVAELLGDLVEWLSGFDRRSILELDYGGLCDLLTWDEMDDDHSARDIQDSLRALRLDEVPRSAELYQSVMGRWAELRSHEMLN